MLKKNTTDTLQNYLFLTYFVMETHLILITYIQFNTTKNLFLK